MNKSFFAASLAASAACLLLSACSDTTLGSKSFEETLDPITIPGGPIPLGVFTIPEFRFPLDLRDQDGYKLIDLVTSVNMRSANLTIGPTTEDPSVDFTADNNPDNFDFLNSMQLDLRATIDGTSQTIQVASLPEGDPQIGTGATEIQLVLEDVDIRDYVEAADVELVINGTGTLPPDFVVFVPDIRFRVGVGIR